MPRLRPSEPTAGSGPAQAGLSGCGLMTQSVPLGATLGRSFVPCRSKFVSVLLRM